MKTTYDISKRFLLRSISPRERIRAVTGDRRGKNLLEAPHILELASAARNNSDRRAPSDTELNRSRTRTVVVAGDVFAQECAATNLHLRSQQANPAVAGARDAFHFGGHLRGRHVGGVDRFRSKGRDRKGERHSQSEHTDSKMFQRFFNK